MEMEIFEDGNTPAAVFVLTILLTMSTIAGGTVSGIERALAGTVTSDTLTHDMSDADGWINGSHDDPLVDAIDELRALVAADVLASQIADRRHGVFTTEVARSFGAVTGYDTTYRRAPRLSASADVRHADTHLFKNGRDGCCLSTAADGTQRWIGRSPVSNVASDLDRLLDRVALLRRVDAATGLTHD